ncbi:hypothetical protein [Corynebacterium oculi]|uniref:Holin n=1 Tax=Corynebacterium oculi TaxID=1544416 RepID=A0A0Q0UC18_9CORY|nr:hypothetical protein [Corynebacterium oculi]KQB83899.1 hypothetical protein Cocul_01975 [Corynebacterium oculi]
MSATISQAVAAALETQPWFTRRKDTIAAVAGTILQMVNLVAAQATEWPPTAAVALAVVVGVLQVVVHAATPGAITPSMATRLEDAASTPAVDVVSHEREGLAVSPMGEH